MTILYVQIRKNQMTVRNPETRQEFRDSSLVFSNSRILIADFFSAEKVLQDLLKKFIPFRWFKFGRDILVVHALEMNEGGLSQVEERVLLEVSFGASRNAHVIIVGHGRGLTDSEVIEQAKKKS
ncbi:hypothetical protein IV99_21725 [Pectobacterium brasiliense]|uniref:YjaA family stress response protein n=1 Tax=Pectobacterium brasiliense TaxID=180957 RepID=UPI0004E6E6BE|nr:YjaA family stress response protein [Pectobacterium brasiliense]KFF61234.1 hypothetical protein IV99_21725 [Pectobacterium brasiliense]